MIFCTAILDVEFCFTVGSILLHNILCLLLWEQAFYCHSNWYIHNNLLISVHCPSQELTLPWRGNVRQLSNSSQHILFVAKSVFFSLYLILKTILHQFTFLLPPLSPFYHHFTTITITFTLSPSPSYYHYYLPTFMYTIISVFLLPQPSLPYPYNN